MGSQKNECVVRRGSRAPAVGSGYRYVTEHSTNVSERESGDAYGGFLAWKPRIVRWGLPVIYRRRNQRDHHDRTMLRFQRPLAEWSEPCDVCLSGVPRNNSEGSRYDTRQLWAWSSDFHPRSRMVCSAFKPSRTTRVAFLPNLAPAYERKLFSLPSPGPRELRGCEIENHLSSMWAGMHFSLAIVCSTIIYEPPTQPLSYDPCCWNCPAQLHFLFGAEAATLASSQTVSAHRSIL